MKPLMPLLISMNQAAFVGKRQIVDNVVLAHEFMEVLKNKRKGKDKLMALKLDMSKAYDRVEWPYIQQMMLQMGFHQIFVNWVMTCVMSASFSFNFNGEVKGCVKPSRGLRQGDPLSHYLFLICAEGLSALLYSAEQQGKLKEFKLGRSSPSVSHLFFADDSFIFCRADMNSVAMINNILDIYSRCSGQIINFEKSAIFFSKNTMEEEKFIICYSLNNIRMCERVMYLGLPAIVG